MKLQTSPGNGLCVLASFAMALDMSTRDLQRAIDSECEGAGDYQLEVFPGLREPYCWRGYHVQQFIRYAVSRGLAVTPIELFPAVAAPLCGDTRVAHPIYVTPDATRTSWEMFQQTILTSSGILTGFFSHQHSVIRGHAVAYEKGIIFDPRGAEFNYSKESCEARHFYANCAWRIDRWR